MTHGQVLRGQGWTGRASVQAAWQQAGGDPATSLHLLRWPWPEADQPPQTCAAWALPPRGRAAQGRDPNPQAELPGTFQKKELLGCPCCLNIL